MKPLPLLSATLILPIPGTWGWGLGVGGSDCVNSGGNCVCPLTVSVIARLLQYFAWRLERLTPEGWRPPALLSDWPRSTQSPTCSPPSLGSSKPRLILLRPREREGGGGRLGGFCVPPWLRFCRARPGALQGHTATPGSSRLNLGQLHLRLTHLCRTAELRPVLLSERLMFLLIPTGD